MSLSIPSAPNAGLFKQGYNKYVNTPPELPLHRPQPPSSPLTPGALKMARNGY